MVIDEITYFSGQGVEVTNTRFTVDDTTYSISYIESVETTVEEKATVKMKPAPIIVGVILLLIGLFSIFAAMNTNEPPLSFDPRHSLLRGEMGGDLFAKK